MLAEDELRIKIGKDVAVLRPTLRASLRLERAYGGFDKLIEALADESATAMALVIRESSDNSTDIPSILDGMANMPLWRGMDVLKEPLISHVMRLAGYDGSEAAQDDPTAKRITFAEHHARLYRIATGWLGWTPETAWTATASEITEAYAGRVEMLKAIFGGSSSKEDDSSQPTPSPDHFNAKVLAFAKAMGTRKVAG